MSQFSVIYRTGLSLVLLLCTAGSPLYAASPTSGYYQGDAGLTASQRAGREIWYKATAGNDRFHTYVFQQRLGILIDWYRVLNSRERDDRFAAWGLINDPDCCQPGSDGCPARNFAETYGFDWCPGDEDLLAQVGKAGYRDPACDFQEADGIENSFVENTPRDQRQSSCDLKFGTSTGALGLRKFPNPKFDKQRWLALNGGDTGSWEGFKRRLSDNPASTDHDVSRLGDGSIEPPFLVGMACGACHIAFDPLNPPDDPRHPEWENLKGAIGNQYARLSEIMVSGMPTSGIEWQVFAHARPGATDTSAVPNDQVNNPGGQNVLVNIAQRPLFDELVDRWRKTGSCEAGESEKSCWCEPGKPAKCWRRSEQMQAVHHILKGGGDSVGADIAIQRVYINIGSCSEACWVNHLTDLRQLDPQQRGYGQTAMDIGQCRRDCPEFRAIEDRVGSVLDFLLSPKAHATDLLEARRNIKRKSDPAAQYEYDDLVEDLNAEFGQDAVNRGKVVFAQNCARCHSSQQGEQETVDFRAVSASTGVRSDWLGDDVPTPASEVGTFRCRALHSNHLEGHIWDEFSSTTYKQRPAGPGIREAADGGRGYYRNLSLVNAWAHAPFMHNNAMGPELCGKPVNQSNDFYRLTAVNASGELLAESQQPECWKYDPSVEGRFKLYKATMTELLNPAERIAKITKLNHDIIIDIGPKLWDGEKEKKVFGLQVVVPEGTNAGLLGNFQYKEFVVDLVLSKTNPKKLRKRLGRKLDRSETDSLVADLKAIVSEVVTDPAQLLGSISKRPYLLELYSTCAAEIENTGHDFGGELNPSDKHALIAFLATL